MTIEAALSTTRPDSEGAVALISGSRNLLEDVPADAILRTALEGCSSKKHMMELVCELFGDPKTNQVRSVLARYGARVSRQHASNVVNDWRRTHHCQPRPVAPHRQARTAVAETLLASLDSVGRVDVEDPVIEMTTVQPERLVGRRVNNRVS